MEEAGIENGWAHGLWGSFTRRGQRLEPVHQEPLRRILHMGYKCCIPPVKPLLNQKKCQKHLTWAKETLLNSQTLHTHRMNSHNFLKYKNLLTKISQLKVKHISINKLFTMLKQSN
ncbi:hypothetical protein ATANTOWER_007406 [Ataeniobius toweri]|uniref:Transposase n=1 Tax=Ataeniobius toweri TaxID=208326 RepID=A0ABU7AMR3_9TELE|nr:hypothetical protein [Ataeniobius toweri]